jgi:hypothetical protein
MAEGLDMTLSHERLKEVLDYNPETGVFTCRIRRGKAAPRKQAGCADKKWGYRLICVDYKLYRSARLAWLWMTGEWPTHFIDHVNRDKLDDRWANLREATPSQNMMNRTNKKRLLPKGVTPNGKGYAARIKRSRQTICLGTYKTPEEAGQAYLNAAAVHHGEFNPNLPA